MGSVLEKYLFLLGSQSGYAFTPEGMGMAIPAIAKPTRRAEESSLPALSDFSLLIRAKLATQRSRLEVTRDERPLKDVEKEWLDNRKK
jgi:hypothetical protein